MTKCPTGFLDGDNNGNDDGDVFWQNEVDENAPECHWISLPSAYNVVKCCHWNLEALIDHEL